ncbi:hypothetical protein AHAS_Ahas12G0134800 [Arachis hypogaea]
MGLGAAEEFYPQRPSEADCIYYLRTRFCGYGSRCCFNHPHDRAEAVGAVARARGWEYLEPIGFSLSTKLLSDVCCFIMLQVFLSLSFDEDLGMSKKKDEREVHIN